MLISFAHNIISMNAIIVKICFTLTSFSFAQSFLSIVNCVGSEAVDPVDDVGDLVHLPLLASSLCRANESK